MPPKGPEDWVTLATAPHQLVAELWQQVLEAEGIAVRLQAADVNSYLGVSSFPCRVLVRRAEYGTAKEALDDIMSNSLPPDDGDLADRLN